VNIVINGEVKELPRPLTLDELLRHFSLPSERVAIELNKAVVRRKDWAEVSVAEGDRLEVIHFVGGG
jgi:thiamine biosynthesis protein ThiS